jgi:heptosyltransferase-2
MVEPVSSPGIKIPELNWPLPENLRQKIELKSNKKRIALAPGGAKNLLRDDALRRWPLENYVLLAGRLIEEGFQVLITGSNTDSWVSESFKSAPVTDLVGFTSITDLVAVYRQCHLVVTHDSGPLHLAIASGTSTLALFGPTIPMEKVPNNKKTRVLWGGENLACRPCYDGKNYADCKNNQCMKDLSVEKVHFEIGQIMKSPQAGPSEPFLK